MELEGRYGLERIIGVGATAEVWRGHDTVLRRTVAVRLLRADRDEQRTRFLAAGRTAAGLSHSSVAAVYDVGVTELPGRGAVPFMVMEFADGLSLQARLEAGRLSWQETARIGADIAAALCEAHGRWVSHGRLAPSHVILTDVGAKVIGFGGDMAEDFDAAARDIQALGVMLTRCLAAGAARRAPQALVAFVDRCASGDPATLPSSDEAAVILAGLADATADLPVAAGRRLAPRRSGRTRWTLGAAVAVAGVAALLVGGAAALGQVGSGGLPWFGHPPGVAAVPPDDHPCADAALDRSGCVPAEVPARPPATTSVPRPVPSSHTARPPAAGPSTAPSAAPSATPSVSKTAGPSASGSPSASAVPSASAESSTSPTPSASAEPSTSPTPAASGSPDTR
ncbi:serine/threonine-protein kinase [Dactylosporangium sp. CA-139066]|uniref:serine/threonine-protein kinase n=1 Tax=Dactylosporangium sp. CA-139066 TaxID=3239930 RepID=UPI003D8C4D9A